MSYPELKNVREYSEIRSGIPFVSTNNETVYFEILSVRNDEGVFDETYLQHVAIIIPEKHLSLSYPAQEVQINNKLDQKPAW